MVLYTRDAKVGGRGKDKRKIVVFTPNIRVGAQAAEIPKFREARRLATKFPLQLCKVPQSLRFRIVRAKGKPMSDYHKSNDGFIFRGKPESAPKPFEFGRYTQREEDQRILRWRAFPHLCGRENRKARKDMVEGTRDAIRLAAGNPVSLAAVYTGFEEGRLSGTKAQRVAVCQCHESSQDFACDRCKRGECARCSGEIRAKPVGRATSVPFVAIVRERTPEGEIKVSQVERTKWVMTEDATPAKVSTGLDASPFVMRETRPGRRYIDSD